MLNILNGALLEAHRWLISNLESVSSSTQLCEQVSTNFDFQWRSEIPRELPTNLRGAARGLLRKQTD